MKRKIKTIEAKHTAQLTIRHDFGCTDWATAKVMGALGDGSLLVQVGEQLQRISVSVWVTDHVDALGMAEARRQGNGFPNIFID